MLEQKFKIYLAIFVFVLFLLILVGLLWLTTGSGQTVGLTLSFAAGLSMIFLPCTLPLVFVIVPLCLGKNPQKGFLMALLFGLGLVITLSAYGVFVAFLGKYLGLDRATRMMFLVAGMTAFLFGLFELGLIRFRFPGIKTGVSGWIQEKGDYLKSLFLGLLLGNAGVGCPNPAFYVLLVYIASTGSLAFGGWLGFVHGLGRAVPLIFLTLLAILGVNARDWIAKKQGAVKTITGWALVIIGVFILTYGLLGMHWWEESIFHQGWNDFLLSIAPSLAELENHPVARGVFVGPLWAGWAMLIGIPVLVWFWNKLKKEIKEIYVKKFSQPSNPFY